MDAGGLVLLKTPHRRGFLLGKYQATEEGAQLSGVSDSRLERRRGGTRKLSWSDSRDVGDMYEEDGKRLSRP